MNNTGPSTNVWSALFITSHQLDVVPFLLDFQPNSLSSPRLLSFLLRKLLETVSKTLQKSRNIICTTLPLTTEQAISLQVGGFIKDKSWLVSLTTQQGKHHHTLTTLSSMCVLGKADQSSFPDPPSCFS